MKITKKFIKRTREHILEEKVTELEISRDQLEASVKKLREMLSEKEENLRRISVIANRIQNASVQLSDKLRLRR